MKTEAIKHDDETETLPTKAIVSSEHNDPSMNEEETRGDESINKREEGTEEREGDASAQQKKKPSPARSSKQNHKKIGAPFPYPAGSMNNRMPFPMNRGGPPHHMGGHPPPYGYPGPGSNFQGGPPPHYPPHPGMGPHSMGNMGPLFQGGPHFGNNGMKGNFGPPQFPPYGGGHGPGPGPYGMPPFGSGPPHPHGMPPFNNNNNAINTSSDSISLSSKNSLNSKKKRTIDGVHSGPMPTAYSFRRTDSNSSSTTAGINTSGEAGLTDDSPRKLDDRDILPGMGGMMFDNNSRPNSRQGPPDQHRHHHHHHRRTHSGASTASSLSVGGFSLSSYERVDAMMTDNNPKRQKKTGAPLVVDTGMRPPSALNSLDADAQSSRFEQLSIDAKLQPNSTGSGSSGGDQSNIFLSLSTSPINAQTDVDATPISKNTKREPEVKVEASNKDSIFKPKGDTEKDRPSDTPTPPIHGEHGDTDMIDDHSMLNRHLRGQSFTPLPHLGSNGGDIKAGSPSAAAIAPQLSWSIAGDTPSLGDLAEWEEEHNKLKAEQKNRPSSTTSTETRNMTISPHDFQLWKEEHDLVERTVSGTTTPLPVFFEQSGNEQSENRMRFENNQAKQQIHPMFHHGPNSGRNHGKAEPPQFWKPDAPMGMPPTPVFAATEFRDDFVGPSPMHRDSMEYNMHPFHLPGHPGQNDRIRNLRGRVPPGMHLPPMPLHIPPHMSAHLPMTSPMGLGPKAGLWSPHHGMGPPMGSPHHLGSPLNSMAQSKRKCVPLKPPIPSKFQGDMEKVKNALVPEFTSLVNFPSHMSQKQAINLPEGMRCCVMCGQACPCSSGNKNKKCKKPDGGLAPRSNNGQDHMGDKNSGYAIIPTQNKGLCTLCDVNVWVVAHSGLEIKWCKGCKNFRPWAAFGDKGLATKCLRCRERQREKYALQKEEKEKARLVAKPKK